MKQIRIYWLSRFWNRSEGDTARNSDRIELSSRARAARGGNPRNKKKSWLLQQLILANIFLGIITLFIGLTLLRITAVITLPIVLSLLFFMMLFPQVKRLQKISRLGYRFCALLVVLVLTVVLVFSFLFPISRLAMLIQALPEYLETMARVFSGTLTFLKKYGIRLNLEQFADFEFLRGNIGTLSNLFLNISWNLQSFFSQLLIVMLLVLFMLFEGDRFFYLIQKSFSAEKSEMILGIYARSVQQISMYLLLKGFISLLTGIIIGTGLWLLGVDFPVVWALFAFLLNFIPNIGSVIHTALVGLFALLQFIEQPYQVVLVLFFLVSVQVFVGYYLEPVLTGDRLGLSPFFILIALLFWGYIWHIPGMLIAVPILSVTKIIFRNIPRLDILASFLEDSSG